MAFLVNIVREKKDFQFGRDRRQHKCRERQHCFYNPQKGVGLVDCLYTTELSPHLKFMCQALWVSVIYYRGPACYLNVVHFPPSFSDYTIILKLLASIKYVCDLIVTSCIAWQVKNSFSRCSIKSNLNEAEGKMLLEREAGEGKSTSHSIKPL